MNAVSHGLKDRGSTVVIATLVAALLCLCGCVATKYKLAKKGAAVATVVVLPVYYISVLGINHHNKNAVKAEFRRRRLTLPLTLAAGETRTGSLFYPMVRSPSSLALSETNDAGSAASVLALDFLHALHVPEEHVAKQAGL